MFTSHEVILAKSRGNGRADWKALRVMNSVKNFRRKIEPPVEKGVLKIERYAQRLTQGYSAYGGSYLWAPGSSHYCSLSN